MRYSEAKAGRIFVIRLEDGEIIHEVIENFAREHAVKAASLIALGGADKDSTVIVGPEIGRTLPIVPMTHMLDDVHEVAGVGTLFPDDAGNPILHMHMACGRKDRTVTGCIRQGIRVWHVLEVILFELADSTGSRIMEPASGFKLLDP